MRMDVRQNPEFGEYTVFDVPSCQIVPRVVWADDTFHQFAYHCGALWCALHEQQVRKVLFLHSMKAVLLDPLDDEPDQVDAVPRELVTVER